MGRGEEGEVRREREEGERRWGEGRRERGA